MTDPIQDPRRLLESDLAPSLRHDLEIARAARVNYPVDAGLARFETTLAGASTLPAGGSVAGFVVLRWFLGAGLVLGLGVAAWLAGSAPDRDEPRARAPTQVVAPEIRSEDKVAELAVSGSRSPAGASSVVSAPSESSPDGVARESIAGVQPALGRGDVGADGTDGGKPPGTHAALPRSTSKSARPDPGVAALEEAKLIDAARKALADDPARTLALTKEAGERFPSGAMVQERRGYAILALIALDRRDEAEAIADDYLARWPKGPLSRRVSEALGLLP